MLELPSLEYASVVQTPTSFEISATVAVKLDACPTCGGHVESKGKAKPCTFWDTPIGTKHVRLEVTSKRYKCVGKGCGSITYRGPDIHPTHRLTLRLANDIQVMAPKRSVKDIERLVGASSEQIWPVISELAERLVDHRFETPRVVAVDDIRFGKKRRFTVIYDGESGYPLGIVEKLDAKGVGKELDKIIDTTKAEIFVSDMNGSNLSLGRSTFKGIPHVADKWHVLDKLQQQLSRIINQTANGLAAGPKAELKAWKKELEGKFAAADARARKTILSGGEVAQRDDTRISQQGLCLKPKWEVLKLYPAVRAVYHARLLLRNVYRATSRASAEQRFDRLVAFASNGALPENAAKAIRLLEKHRTQILAYFDVMSRDPDGSYRGPTTNQAEARNGKIKAMWKQSRGVQNTAYLNLRVVFEPYVLGVNLLLCDICGGSEVLAPEEGLKRAGMDVRDLEGTRCSSCAPFTLIAA